MKRSTLAAALAASLALATAARADRILVPDIIDRGDNVPLAYRVDRTLRGDGVLEIDWTDVLGRQVAAQHLPARLDGRTDIPFTLDTRRAVALKNHLRARLVVGGVEHGQAEAEMIIRERDDGWNDYRITMWEPQRPAQWQTLKRIGVSGGIVFGDREGKGPSFTMPQIDALLAQNLRWYVENIATDFYAAYHRWLPGRPVNAEFLEVQRRYAENPQDPSVFFRRPSLSDAGALRRIQDRLGATVRLHERYGPLFYNLGDEPGIADLSAHWDFDFSTATLAEFRDALRQRHGALAALNNAWGRSFPDWDAVVPATTAEAIAQPTENFAAWGEFKAWMDQRFARTIREGGEAVHRVDPKARVAITGGQIPGWGGWNYATLAHAVGVMETGSDGFAFDMARSFDPSLVLLTTAFGAGGAEEHRVWRRWLRGGRGLILWDDRNDHAAPDGSLGPRGRDGAPYYQALTGGLGALLIQSQRQSDPVAVYYSPASYRVQWLLDRRAQGGDWSRRTADDEYEENDLRKSVAVSMRLLERLGLRPRFLSALQVEAGELGRSDVRVLVLPHTIAVSATEAEAFRRFVDRGGTIVADILPGAFDESGRKRDRSPLSDLFDPAGGNGTRATRGSATVLPANGGGPSEEGIQKLKRLLAQADVLSRFPLETTDGGPPVEPDLYAFRNGNVSLLALHRKLPPMAEASEPQTPGPDLRAEDSRRVRLNLSTPSYLYEIREGQALGRTDRIDLALDPVTPTLLAISAAALPKPVIEAPATVARGETATIRLSVSTPSPAALHVYRIEVIDPAGQTVPHYGGNVSAPVGRAGLLLPIALNDPTGSWEIRMIDRLSGMTASTLIEVRNPPPRP